MNLHITRFGTKIAVKDGLFELSWFDDNQVLQKETHSPLTVKSLWVQEGAIMTIAAQLLALEHTIDLVLMDQHGMPQARVQGFELHTTPSVQKAQVIVSVGVHAVAFVKYWTAVKMQNQADFLDKLKARRDRRKQRLLETQSLEIRKLRKQVLALDGKQVKDIAEELRGFEGAAGQLYFQTLSDVLPDEYRFNGRSRMPARDPFNAFLNYGYAILYGKTEQALLLAGIHPCIGFLHRDGYRIKSMVFDLIEPYRVWIDRVVFRLFSRKIVSSNHTAARDGGLYLNTPGKKLLTDTLKEYFDEKKEELDNVMVNREHFLRQSAVRFARRLLQTAQLDNNEEAALA